ncbi:MAG: YaiO family outer membrane beta-barrel protein [bacterium]|nr:YaiO family outer membrane beta-barrel protein [bacterium]
MSTGERAAPRFVDAVGLGTLEPWLETLRNRGVSGGLILQHRALRRSRAPRNRVAGAALLSVVMFVLWYLALDVVADVWLSILEFCRAAVGMAGFTSLVTYELGPFNFSIPYLTFPSGLPDNFLWWVGTAITAVLVVVSLITPHRYLPLAYFLRVVAFFQATSQIYFALWLHHFPYGGAGYVHGNLIAGLMFVSLVPLVLGFTYHIFEFSVGRKILLTVIMLAHLTVMIPFQFFMHALVIYSFSLLFMPIMFFIFGLPANVMMFIAFFGWGFSWRNQWDVTRDGRGSRPAAATAVAVVVLLALSLGVTRAAEGQTTRQEIEEQLPEVIAEREPPLDRSFNAGMGWGKYAGDSEPNNGQSMRVTWSRPARHAYSVDVGRQQRFGESSYGIGASYTHVLDAATSLTAGASTGTGDLLPEYRLDVAATRGILGNVLTAGLSHEKTKTEYRNTGVHLGASRWFEHWILSAGGSVYYGSPGKTSSPSVTVGVTWYTWQRLYLGAGATWGRVNYAVGPSVALVDYDSEGYTLGASYWLDGESGLGAGFSYGESDFYTVRGYNLSYFRRF